MSAKKYVLRLGNDTYTTLNLNGATFTVVSNHMDHGSEADDVFANNYISGLSAITCSLSGSDLVVNFNPCIDNELLTRVSEGKTRVRLQLLVHKVSNCSSHRRQSHWHCLRLPFGYYWENDERIEGSNWARTKGRYGNQTDANTITYFDLTTAQLQAGTVTFPNATCHAHGSVNITGAPLKITHLAVEAFCPALYRSNKDIYYYERETTKKLSSNCVEIRQ